jgi:hypothetical protein
MVEGECGCNKVSDADDLSLKKVMMLPVQLLRVVLLGLRPSDTVTP